MPTDMQVINEAPNRFLTRDYLLHVLGSAEDVAAFLRRCFNVGLLTARDGGWVRTQRITEPPPDYRRALLARYFSR